MVHEKLAARKAGTFTRFDVFARPIKDNRSKEILPEGKRLTQKDLEGLPGCKVCMNWLAEGILGQIPPK